MSDPNIKKTNQTMKTGKRFELTFLTDLMQYICNTQKHWDVFQPIVDDNGIDYIVRTAADKYVEIQVKGRTPLRPFTIDTNLIEHKNYWLVLYYDNTRYILKKNEVIKVRSTSNHINPKTLPQKILNAATNRDFGCFVTNK